MKDSGNGQAPHTAKEDGCLRYYRFYPVVDGEDQGVGLFHVLSDSGIPVAKQKALLRRFDEHLPFPQFYEEHPDVRTEAYFTEAGMEFFKKDIEKLISQIERHSIFEVEKKTLSDINVASIVYQDEYQILVRCG
jgi:hypothetical protein